MSGRSAPPTQHGGGRDPGDPRAPRTRAAGGGSDAAATAPRPAAPRTAAAPPVTGGGRAPRTQGAASGARPDPADLARLLPAVLAELYTPVREFDRGGQGDVLLCAVKSDPAARVVVKLFKRTVGPGEADPRAAWRDLDPRHVVRFVGPGLGGTGSRWWEVLEYCAAGTLRDRADYYGGALPVETVRDVVRQLTDALDYLHTLHPRRVVHRDVKPDNVLIRSVDPLDVVLTDFGLAVASDHSYEFRTVANTPAYAAPEVVGSGIVPPSGDWWSLGMTIAELAAGRHPYRLPNGEMMDPRLIVAELGVHDVPLDQVEDPRLNLLVRGLLTRDPERRWRAGQVRSWLAGGSPEVATNPAGPRWPRVRAFAPESLRGSFADPRAIAAALAADWRGAGRLVAGRDLEELGAWLDRHFADHGIQDLVAAVSRGRSGDRTSPFSRVDRAVAELIARLDPAAAPVFRGESMHPADLLHLPASVAAETDGRLAGLVDALHSSGALRSLDALHPGLTAVDVRWHAMCDQADAWFAQVRDAGAMTPVVRAMILAAAVEAESTS